MKYAIIVAGGVGSRSGDSLPKQFHEICGIPMLSWTLKAFHQEDPSTGLIVVMHPDYMEYWEKLRGDDCPAHIVTPGGATRSESVWKGLAMVPEEGEGLVAVHDAARPLVSSRVIREGWETAQTYLAAFPGVAVADSLRRKTEFGTEAVDRSQFIAVQTPQVFDKKLLKEAYDFYGTRTTRNSIAFNYSDDATLMQDYGYSPQRFDGDPENIKVTYPSDFMLAEFILKTRT